jgi:hypothetical protein
MTEINISYHKKKCMVLVMGPVAELLVAMTKCTDRILKHKITADRITSRDEILKLCLFYFEHNTLL